MKFKEIIHTIFEEVNTINKSRNEAIDLFCRYFKTNEQMIRFLSKYKQFIEKDKQELEIYNQYIEIFENEEYSTDRVREVLNWFSLALPKNIDKDLRYILLALDSHIGGIDGRDDEIVFKVLDLINTKCEYQRFFIYKYNRKIVINKMIYNRSSIFAIYGYVKKYVGDGIEQAT